ncbi:hypothetical protein [uncultured Roseobacter sp.]|uniref:hypothetical protein n=1 Tax=uncultured Roseobacter sp. TaxID=114847 RepID=UPI00261188F8|nr:hypothetical protein [uncultured Roseobacter sp.]
MFSDKRIFVVPANWQLRDESFYLERIWHPAAAKGISRVMWLDALTLIYRFDGRVFLQSGKSFDIPEIDDVFCDPENRWMSYFLEADRTGKRPKRYCRVLSKLRLISLYCDIVEKLSVGSIQTPQVTSKQGH